MNKFIICSVLFVNYINSQELITHKLLPQETEEYKDLLF